MSRIEVRRQRFVKNPWTLTRYSFVDGPRMRAGRGVCLTAGRWIAYINYRSARFEEWA